MRVPRDGSVVVPLVRMPSAERETGGVAVDVVGAGEVSGRQARGLDPARPVRTGRHRRRSRIAVDAGVQAEAARRRRTAIALGDAGALHAAGGAHRQRRGSALSRARLGRRPRAGAGTVCSPQQPAELPQGDAAARLDGVERRGRGTAGASRHRRRRRGARCRSRRDAPARTRRRSRRSSCICSGRMHGRTRAAARVDLPALDLPVSRTGLELHATHRASASTPQPGAFRVANDPVSLPEAFRQSGMSIAVAPGNAKNESGLQALVDRYRSGSGGTIVGALPVHVAFPSVRTVDLPRVRADRRRPRAVGGADIQAGERPIMIINCRTSCLVTALLAVTAHMAAAQRPPRPSESSRAVTLSLAEYNRLIDLASRPPQAPSAPPVRGGAVGRRSARPGRSATRRAASSR